MHQQKEDQDVENFDISFKKRVDLIFFIQVNNMKIVSSMRSNVSSSDFDDFVSKDNIDMIFSYEFNVSFANSNRSYRKNQRRKRFKKFKLVVIKIMKIQVNVIEYEIVNVTLNCEVECNLINKSFAKKLTFLFLDDAHVNVVFIDKSSMKTQNVYFSHLNVTNRKSHDRFFEKFFLRIDIDNHMTLNMS